MGGKEKACRSTLQAELRNPARTNQQTLETKMRNRKEQRAINTTRAVHQKYAGRIVMAGEFNGYRQACVWHCLACDQFFRQRYESIWSGAKTRCMCNHDQALTQETLEKCSRSAKGIGRSAGHTCVPSYDAADVRWIDNARSRLVAADLPVHPRYKP